MTFTDAAATLDQPPDFSQPWFRLLVSMSIGAVAATYCYVTLTAQEEARVAADFTWHWLGARALIGGQNPYVTVTAGGPYDLIAPYIYPLTTAIAAIPFSAWLPPAPAAALFIGTGSTLLAWGVTSSGYHRLPLFLSVPFLWAASSGQFSPIIMAGALVPALGWLAPVKPNLGLAALAYRPTRGAFLGSAAFVALAFLFNPDWVQDWYAALGKRVEDVYWLPIAVLGGPLLLLAVTRWRRPEARMLLVLSLMPQLFLFYDQLLLWLIPRSWKGSVALTAMSWIALYVGNSRIPVVTEPGTHHVVTAYAPVIMVLMFLPSLVMILRRPNESDAAAV